MNDPTMRNYYVETPFAIAAVPLLSILSRPPPLKARTSKPLSNRLSREVERSTSQWLYRTVPTPCVSQILSPTAFLRPSQFGSVSQSRLLYPCSH